MATKFKITSAMIDGMTLLISAKVCLQIGTRNDAKGKTIPIIACRSVTISISTVDMPETGKLNYIKQKIEEAYAELPDLTVVKQLIGKHWII